MSFWEDWKVKESQLTEVVGIEEKDFEPVGALMTMVRVLKNERKLSKAIIVQKLLNLAVKDKNIQVMVINMLHEGFDSVMQDALQDAKEAMATFKTKPLGGVQ